MRLRSLICLLVLAVPNYVLGQDSQALDLLNRVPGKLGFCLVAQDLRGHFDRVQKSEWWPKLRANTLIDGALASPDVRALLRFEEELKRHLDIDFATLRDQIFGDAVVLAYQPPLAGSAVPEQGILMLRARKAETLASLIEKVNTAQRNAGELSAVEEQKHNGRTYFRRVHQRATHFYVQEGTLFAITSHEELLREFLDRGKESRSLAADHFRKAGVQSSALMLWLNPRIFDAELTSTRAQNPGPAEAVVLTRMHEYWKGLDGVVVNAHLDDSIELQFSLIGRRGVYPAKSWDVPHIASELWRRFPRNAMVTAAIQVEFVKAFRQVMELAPEKDQKGLEHLLMRAVGPAIGLDIFSEVLPNIGPDVGFSIFASEPATKGGLPQAIVAVAVKSAPKESPVDQILFKSAQLFASLAVIDFNRKSPDLVRIRTTQLGGVEVKYLTQEKLLPAGFQPALALKDGYLLLATSPEAVERFKTSAPTDSRSGEIPLVRVSPPELARFLKRHRDVVIDRLVKKGNEAPFHATRIFDGVVSMIECFDSVTLTQKTGAELATWIVRVTPIQGPTSR